MCNPIRISDTILASPKQRRKALPEGVAMIQEYPKNELDPNAQLKKLPLNDCLNVRRSLTKAALHRKRSISLCSMTSLRTLCPGATTQWLCPQRAERTLDISIRLSAMNHIGYIHQTFPKEKALPVMLTFENPVFQSYAVAAALIILKLSLHSYFTVYRMIKSNGGLLNPEDLSKTILNPEPSPEQIKPNDYVERSRRMHRNEMENGLPFLACGILFVLTDPNLFLSQVFFYGYVLARILHFVAYAAAMPHEVRATFFTAGSLLTIVMALMVLLAAIR